MRRRPPRSKRTDTLFPYTTLFRSLESQVCGWQASDSNILARVEVNLMSGYSYYYEPSNQVALTFRAGQISNLTFEILDRKGNALPMEPDSDRKSTRLNSSH